MKSLVLTVHAHKDGTEIILLRLINATKIVPSQLLYKQSLVQFQISKSGRKLSYHFKKIYI